MRSLRRVAGLIVVLLLAVAVLSAPEIASAQFALRTPQVPVAGDALQNLLTGTYGQTLDVRRDQLAVDKLPIDFFTRPVLGLESELPELTVGIYDPSQAVPQLIPVFSPGMPIDAEASFAPRLSPVRFTVFVIDEQGKILRRDVYPGLQPRNLAVYVSGPNGTYYSEDHRNAGSAAQAIWFAATGSPFFGPGWIALESSPVTAGSVGDYVDVLLGIGVEFVDPVRKSSWGQVKARFR